MESATIPNHEQNEFIITLYSSLKHLYQIYYGEDITINQMTLAQMDKIGEMFDYFLELKKAYVEMLECLRDSRILSESVFDSYRRSPRTFSIHSIWSVYRNRNQTRPSANDAWKVQRYWLLKLNEVLKPISEQMVSLNIEIPGIDLNSIQEYSNQIYQILIPQKLIEQVVDKKHQLGKRIINEYWSPFFSKIFIIEQFIQAYEMPPYRNANQADVEKLVDEFLLPAKVFAERFARSIGIIPDTIHLFKTPFDPQKHERRTSSHLVKIPRINKWLHMMKSCSENLMKIYVGTIYEIEEWGYTFGEQKNKSIVLVFDPSQL